MDAHALLTSQGWRGTGHSLHMTDDSIGLQKPIMLSKKVGNKGIGKVQHFTSDQWWLHAFDEQLKGLDTSKEGKIVQNVTTGKLNTFERGSLSKYSVYSTFVRGGFLEGTLSHVDDTESSDQTDTNADDQPTKSDGATATPRKETKEEKRARKEQKKARKEAKRQRKEERARKRAAKLERKLASGKSSSGESTSKDEEKTRRRARKEEKRRKRKQEEKAKSQKSA
ncbi:hypothetical protein S40285_07237 [Stachybotrys chlorohalonatus IBT 40285]|uniref:G-patch domain-containing protein n=1 Tax=Stachybotrys chlorohalonatus (strain IBT 40285) TaxID=1283841 RepID=A0A084QGE4_STAC4|nr:hypothetical protein S40285_07237 [Stachybotrys chlorohalonata IBT 40285]